MDDLPQLFSVGTICHNIVFRTWTVHGRFIVNLGKFNMPTFGMHPC